jgi:hypothetical protein
MRAYLGGGAGDDLSYGFPVLVKGYYEHGILRGAG